MESIVPLTLGKIEVKVDEILRLLQQQPRPATVTGVVSSRLERWLFSLKPLAVVATATGRQIVNVAVIVYMAKGGSLGPIEPYVKYLIGIQ